MPTAPRSWPPRPPRGLAPPGRALWRDICARFRLAPHEIRLLAEACRTLDLVTRLDKALAEFEDLTDRDARRLAIELRQQRLTFGRLVGALRLPDAAPGTRTQHRGGPRGVYGIRGAVR